MDELCATRERIIGRSSGLILSLSLAEKRTLFDLAVGSELERNVNVFSIDYGRLVIV